jgi:hypothetical protein
MPSGAGGLLVAARTATTRTRGGTVEITYVTTGGLPLDIWAGLGVGLLPGALVGFQVWGLLGRRSREDRD